MTPIYLDHTATTPVAPEVLEAMRPCFTEMFGNASSSHLFGRRAKDALEHARAVIANAMGATPGEVFFTSGGTESDNLAVKGGARAGLHMNRRRVIAAAAEHHAVRDAAEALESEGYEVVILSVNGCGAVDPVAAAEALAVPSALLSVMHANNEVGTINPVAALAEAAHALGTLMHTDAVQSFGRIPVRVDELGADLMTVSAHKLYGPKGIGALYIRRGTEIVPLMNGGGQERGIRPGTENVALAVGFACAVQLAMRDMNAESLRLAALRDRLQAKIAAWPFVRVNGDQASRLPHILSVSFDIPNAATEGEMLVPAMDLEGVAVSSGSACTSGSIQPSHVLLAMGYEAGLARATLRFSFGKLNTPADVDTAYQALARVLRRAGAPV